MKEELKKLSAVVGNAVAQAICGRREGYIPEEFSKVEILSFDREDGPHSGIWAIVEKIPYWGNKSARLAKTHYYGLVVTREIYREMKKQYPGGGSWGGVSNLDQHLFQYME